jgi:N-acetylneuraminic acid mutarotase
MAQISDNEVLFFGGGDGIFGTNDSWIYNNSSDSWRELDPPISPDGRGVGMMARISNNEVLLFGSGEAPNSDDTWIYNNSSGSWTELDPPISPDARSEGMMARISDNEVLLFGGEIGFFGTNDTWIYNNSSGSWRELDPPISPDARSEGMMVRISDSEIMLFGGSNSGSYYNDTWIFNNSSGSWTELDPPVSPDARYGGMMARISDTEALLFGGANGEFDPISLNDTWLFDNSSGSWTELDPAVFPNARFFGMMAQISNNEALLFGGAFVDGGVLSALDDTWSFNKSLGSWVSTQPRDINIGTMSQISDNEVLLFGSDDRGSDGQTWEYDNNLNWSNFTPPLSPSTRFFSMMSQITDTETLLFGGFKNDGSFVELNDTWIFDNSSGSWTELDPPISPDARFGGMMARISDNEVLLFGGGEAPNLDDTWIFNNSSGSWTELSPPISPDARYGGMMARISENEVLLFGGISGFFGTNDTWIFNNSSGSWTEISPPISPDARYGGMMARISENEVMLFGGYNSGSSYLDDTWIFDKSSGSWTELDLSSAPSPRALSMISRISDTEVLLLGGTDLATQMSLDNEIWIFEVDRSVELNNLSIIESNSVSAEISMDLLNSNLSSTHTFKLGTEPNIYTSIASFTTIASGTTQSVDYTATGLIPNTNYFLRASATTSFTWTESEEISFWTLDTEPNQITSLFQSNASESSSEISLSWTAVSENYLVLETTESTEITNADLPVDAEAYSVDQSIGNLTVVAVTTSNTYTKSDLGKNQSFKYVVIPFNAGTVDATNNYNIESYKSVSAYTIPTLGEWGIIAFGSLMLLGGVWQVRRVV